MILLLVTIFVVGYISISLETYIRINKAAIALLTGVACWLAYMLMSHDKEKVIDQLAESLGDLSGILFFLLSAMTIVEIIDAHKGFSIITNKISQTDKRALVWIVSLIAFFLSPILDNLTTSIVMVLLLRKLVANSKQRLIFTGMIIIAANAGGVWSPIGDVTSTMLWMGNQVTAKGVLMKLFLPSLACLLVPLFICSMKMKGKTRRPLVKTSDSQLPISQTQQYIVLCSGLMVLLSVPVLKSLTGLPPYMCILFGLGILWIITEIIHHNKESEKGELTVAEALGRIDTPSILFFLGILLGIAALQATGVLQTLAQLLERSVSNSHVIVMLFGLLSSVVDNVPLVAAAQAMYSLDKYPTDDSFWLLLTYCSGTGGSILLIGSAAGVAAMGMENISFVWYLKKVSFLALAGFFAGIGVYFLQLLIFK